MSNVTSHSLNTSDCFMFDDNLCGLSDTFLDPGRRRNFSHLR